MSKGTIQYECYCCCSVVQFCAQYNILIFSQFNYKLINFKSFFRQTIILQGHIGIRVNKIMNLIRHKQQSSKKRSTGYKTAITKY